MGSGSSVSAADADEVYGFTDLLHATGELYLALTRRTIQAIEAGSEMDGLESASRARDAAVCFEWMRTLLTTHATRHLFEDQRVSEDSPKLADPR